MKLDKMFPKPTNLPPEVPNIPVSDISIQRLIDDGLLILYREIANLKMLSVRGKLEPAAARDLRDHLKLLFELKDRENELLKGLSDEELEQQLKQQKELNENIQDQSSLGNDKEKND